MPTKAKKATKYSRALVDAMEAAGIGSGELAQRIGAVDGQVSQWRSGSRPMPAGRARAIAAILNVPPERISEPYDRLLQSGCIPRPGDVSGSVPAGHIALDRLAGFDYDDGPSFILLPEFYVLHKIGLTPIEDVRWTLQPTDAMAPQIARGTMVLVDTRVCGQTRVVDGAMHAVTLYDRPHIRRLLPRRDAWALCGFEDDRDRILVSEADLPKLDVRGLVIAWL